MPDIRFQIANSNSPGPSECEGSWPVPGNAYDHRHRRIRKTVQSLTVTMPPAPSPPSETYEWTTVETHTYVWDGNNIVLERIAFADGTTRVSEYFWGPDMSGTEQGAGGVGGLLAVSIDGAFYIPCFDHNGNIVWYVSESGAVAAAYVYDPYGNVVETTGALAEQFSFGFSTKVHDRETGLVGYQRRFLRPAIGRWLNRDPIEEEGGENLYSFCHNNPITHFDRLGNKPEKQCERNGGAITLVFNGRFLTSTSSGFSAQAVSGKPIETISEVYKLDMSSSVYIIGLESFSYKMDDPPAPFHGCQFTSRGEIVHPTIPLQGSHRLHLAMSRLETIASKRGLDAFLDTLGPVGSARRYATVRSWKTASDLLQKSFDSNDKEWTFPTSDSDRRNFWKENVHSLFPSIQTLIMREMSLTPTNIVQMIDQSQPGCLFRPTILPVREKSIDDLTIE